MKVKELIQKLKEFDSNADVFVENFGDDVGMYEYEPESVRERTSILGVKSGIIIRMVE